MPFSLTTTLGDPIINTQTPKSFVLHAANANTTIIQLSNDNGFLDFEEMAPNDSIFFKNFQGQIWAKMASSTGTLYIAFKFVPPQTGVDVMRK